MERKILFLDASYGISGDMAIASLIDIGVPVDFINDHLSHLPIKGLGIRAKKIRRNSISGTMVDVDEGDFSSELSFDDMMNAIHSSPLPEKTKKLSSRIIENLARAEEKVHDLPPGKAHFHEVGRPDTLVDAIGISLCLEYSGIERVYSSPIPLQRGEVKTSHGILPLPSPAVMYLLEGTPVESASMDGELVTPTGAAILKSVVDGYMNFPEMILEKTGYGFGHREIPERLNALRSIIGRETSKEDIGRRRIIVIETNIDDMNPNNFDPLMREVFLQGALDAFITPIIMKKSRPAFLFTVLCEEEKRDSIVESIFRNSTTIGIRFFEVKREELQRRIQVEETPLGKVRFKFTGRGGEDYNITPEYEDILRISEERGIPFKWAHFETMKWFYEKGKGGGDEGDL